MAGPVIVDRPATCNVYVGLSNADAEAALLAVINEGAELIAVQEWGPDRRPILLRLAKTTDMRWCRGPLGGGPVLWDFSRYGLLRCRSVLLARREFVGHLPGRKSRLPASWATEVLLVDELHGGEVAIWDFHLTAEVQFGEGYRKDWKHRLRVARHKREVRRLRRRIRRVAGSRRRPRPGRRGYAMGDGNFDGLQLPPLISCWKDRPGGTLGHRAVDAVFGPQRAAVVRPIRTKSDHKAVLAVYERKP